MKAKLAKAAAVRVVKVDESLQTVFGFAVVSTVGGKPYVDSQGHHIPEAAMIRAAANYMAGDRPALKMHGSETAGKIIFAWPLTADIARAFDIACDKTGLMVGMMCEPDTFAKFKNGTFTGFSIGGEGKIVEAA